MTHARRSAAPDPAAVLSVVLLRRSPRPQVLVGVRAVDTNPRHPGVVSVPTMRIPLSIAHQLCAGDVPSEPGSWVRRGRPRQFGAARAGTSVEGMLIESIMTRKLISGNLLETREIFGTCSVRCVSRASVEDPVGRDGTAEDTLMVTLLADCAEGAKYLEGPTASYSRLTWIAPDLLVEAWRRGDAHIVFPDANPFEICIHGLCIASAVSILERGD